MRWHLLLPRSDHCNHRLEFVLDRFSKLLLALLQDSVQIGQLFQGIGIIQLLVRDDKYVLWNQFERPDFEVHVVFRHRRPSFVFVNDPWKTVMEKAGDSVPFSAIVFRIEEPVLVFLPKCRRPEKLPGTIYPRSFAGDRLCKNLRRDRLICRRDGWR